MSSAVGNSHSGAGPLSLISCVRESSPLQDFESDHEKNSATKRKFWNPKKWFKRKHKQSEDTSPNIDVVEKDTLRSRSTSELSIADEPPKRSSRSGNSMYPGLSVSHDSVFHSPNSGSDMELDAAQRSSSLSISQPRRDVNLQAELSERLRRVHGDTSEDDEGLPRSPCNSPTTTDALLDKTAIKDLPTKSHSTCSDGSFFSMDSSEMDEEPFSQSRHSSKLSLQEKRLSDQDSDLELGPSTSTAPLNHSAAHHKSAVRPNKRRAPVRNKRTQQVSSALPTTIEINEESSIRSISPETTSKETVTEIYSMSSKTTLTETQQKCSSLPPGLAPPGLSNKLNRSRSNAGSDHFTTLEEDVEKEDRSDKSFFERLFPRKSGRKRKSKEEKVVVTSSSSSTKQRIDTKPMAAPRSSASSRQRIQPIDLPPSPDSTTQEVVSTSPLQLELESRFKQRHTLASPVQSPKLAKKSDSSVIIPTKLEPVRKESRGEEIKSKVKLPGLSSLQQRALSLNDEVDESGFKSLNMEAKITKPVTKSHSFKTQPQEIASHPNTEKDKRGSIIKAASLDSVKVLDEVSSSNYSPVSSVTVSGPSHTAIVNITNEASDSFVSQKVEKTEESVKEVTTSVTKIQLKRETTHVTQSTISVPKFAVPEFLSRHQLNKVETKTTSNVVFSMNSPRIIDEQVKSQKSVFNWTEPVRKFSQENLEIVEKSEEESDSNGASNQRFKKNEPKRKISITPDSPKREDSVDISDRSSQDSFDNLDEKTESSEDSAKEKSDSAVKRRKSYKLKNDDEPELMKVFARRSLKLKDVEILSQEVDTLLAQHPEYKDTPKVESPLEEKKPQIEPVKSPKNEPLKSPVSEPLKSPKTEPVEIPKSEPVLAEPPKSPLKESQFIETSEVTLRKPITNNNFYNYQRGVSVGVTKEVENKESRVKKHTSFSERRKITNNWMSNMKNGGDLIEQKISQDEIITEISPKNEFIHEEFLTEPKNFNQRKAEWEKRAQQGQKKSVP